MHFSAEENLVKRGKMLLHDNEMNAKCVLNIIEIPSENEGIVIYENSASYDIEEFEV